MPRYAIDLPSGESYEIDSPSELGPEQLAQHAAMLSNNRTQPALTDEAVRGVLGASANLPQVPGAVLPTEIPSVGTQGGPRFVGEMPEQVGVLGGFGVELGERAAVVPRTLAQMAGAVPKIASQFVPWDPKQYPIPESQPLFRVGQTLQEVFQEGQPEVPDLGHAVTAGLTQAIPMLATGSPLGAAVLGGTMEFDDAYQRARASGMEPDEAFARSLGYASVAGLLENKLGVGRILRRAGMTPQRLTALGVSRGLVGNVPSGAGEETAQRVAQDVIVGKETPSLESVGRAFQEEGLPGGIVQGILGAPVTIAKAQPRPFDRAVEALSRQVDDTKVDLARIDEMAREALSPTRAQFTFREQGTAPVAEETAPLTQAKGATAPVSPVLPDEVEGFTRRARQIGAITEEQFATLPPEQQAALEAQTPWAFDYTDTREDSPTKGFTVYVPERASLEEATKLVRTKVRQATKKPVDSASALATAEEVFEDETPVDIYREDYGALHNLKNVATLLSSPSFTQEERAKLRAEASKISKMPPGTQQGKRVKAFTKQVVDEYNKRKVVTPSEKAKEEKAPILSEEAVYPISFVGGKKVDKLGRPVDAENRLLKPRQAMVPGVRDFWVDPDGKMSSVAGAGGHLPFASDYLSRQGEKELAEKAPYEGMFSKGFTRMTIINETMMIENSRGFSRKQMSALKDYAIENGLRLVEETGRLEGRVIYDPREPGLRQAMKPGEETRLTGPRLVLNQDEFGLTTNKEGRYNHKVLLGRLANKLPPAEMAEYKKAGIEQFLSRDKTPDEVAKWMTENGPKVEHAVYGMEGKVSEARKEFDDLQHSLIDSDQGFRVLAEMRGQGLSWEEVREELSDSTVENYNDYASLLKIAGVKRKIDRYNELKTKMEAERASKDTLRATSAYSSVSAFPTNEPMPEWTTSKEGKNVQRVDVVVPARTRADWNKTAKPGDSVSLEPIGDKTFVQDDIKWRQDNLHENLPNTLGWAMIQYKTGPKSEKIAVIVEAQSRWGQERYKNEPISAKMEEPNDVAWTVRKRGKDTTPDSVVAKTAEEAITKAKKNWDVEYPPHDLLKDYNRLILKAAIEQAKKEGATHIVVSDAETAMMSEGHDAHLQARGEQIVGEENLRRRLRELYPTREEYDRNFRNEYTLAREQNQITGEQLDKWKLIKKGEVRPEQEPGMRLNYDTILPKIMEELTGGKGEKVSLGEHKNAFERTDMTEEDGSRVKRKNLIFRNPDGTPKTDVSGMMFPLSSTKDAPYTLFEKRNAMSVETGKFSEGGNTVATKALGLQDGDTAFDAIQRLLDNPRGYLTDGEQALARFLLDHFEGALRGSTVHPWLTAQGSDKNRPVYFNGAIGLGMGVSQDVSFVARSLLHEAAHAASESILLADPAKLSPSQQNARVQLNRLRKRIIEQMPAEMQKRFKEWQKTGGRERNAGSMEDVVFYGLQDEHEFLSQVFDQPVFRDYLNSIPSGNRTLWEVVKEALQKLLGIREGSALGELLEQFSQLSVKENEASPSLRMAMPAVRNALNYQSGQKLPDYQERPIATEEFSQKFALEHMPVLGIGNKKINAWGGRNRVVDQADKAVARWFFEKHGAGPAIASAFGEDIRGKVNKVFKANKQGDLNVTPTNANQSLKTSDVFEALRTDPNSYMLTPEQANVFRDVVEPALDRMSTLAEKYKLVQVLDEHGDFLPYFPRIVTKHPSYEDGGQRGGGKFGTKQFFQKQRAFKTEQEGWQKGYEYETDVEARLVKGVERLYRAMADQRLATDEDLNARSYKQVLRDLRATYAAELAAGTMTMGDVRRIAKGVAHRGMVYSPAFWNKIFDPKTADMLNREFRAEQSQIRQKIVTVGNLLKSLKLGFDLGVGFIQMLPTLYRNPGIWGKAQWHSLQALTSPEPFAEYVRQNEEAVSQMAQLGSSVGRLNEMIAGQAKGEPLTRVPLIGPVAKAFGRQFQTALDVAKIELWKAWRDVTPESEWSKLIQAIESQLLTARMESSMVPHSRAMTERALLLSSSYYRGAVNLVGAMLEKGVSGRLARQAMTSFALGTTATFYAVAKALDMDDDEIEKRFNPTNPNFLMWSVKFGDHYTNVGIGGVFRSWLRMLGKTTATSIEHPENWGSLSSEKNPMVAWYRGHASPGVGTAWDLFSGRDFLGRETGVKEALKGAGPLWMQGNREGAKPTPSEVAASFFGMQTTPESYSSTRERLVKREAGKPLGELSVAERRKALKAVEPELDKLKGDKKRMAEQATKADFQRKADLASELPRDVTKWLESNQLDLPGYKPSFVKGGQTITLTQEEQDKLQAAVAERYEFFIRRLMTNENWSRLTQERKEKMLADRLEQARKQALTKVKREINRLP